ncbi:hypothetical protein EVAR_69712_1 [Eumeta japonica]|uniref:Uncharacterized protein n=1 Tax=Eumeta variegata TaxID=151549 RepID=A0A4C1T7F8_EUMVA|nr:hypothetical protein EVAR_69712_1 [Eumeta japonica]
MFLNELCNDTPHHGIDEKKNHPHFARWGSKPYPFCPPIEGAHRHTHKRHWQRLSRKLVRGYCEDGGPINYAARPHPTRQPARREAKFKVGRVPCCVYSRRSGCETSGRTSGAARGAMFLQCQA